MSVSAWAACALVYFYMTIVTYLYARTHYKFKLGDLAREAPSYESRIVILTFGSLFWPVWVMWHIVPILRFSGRLFKGVWKLFFLYIKGIRDLLPRRAAKIPETRVLTKDQEKE